MNKNKAITLVELLIAISLVGMIILAVMAIDVASRRFLSTANYAAQVQSEASPVLERMAKDITRAYGQRDNSGITIADNTTITIRQLDAASPHTYADFSDDPGIRYEFNSAQITRQTRATPSASWVPIPAEVIARNIESGAFSPPGADGMVGINMTARRMVDGSLPTFENPRVTLETSVSPRSTSLN